MMDKFLKWATVAVLLALVLVLVLAVLAVRVWAYTYCDPYMIDYNAPGVDITSEGP